MSTRDSQETPTLATLTKGVLVPSPAVASAPKSSDTARVQAEVVAVKTEVVAARTDLNEQLRRDARELRSLADTYLIEEGRVILRATIPSK
jgi:hypothetical protein